MCIRDSLRMIENHEDFNERINDAAMSFVSNHASFSMYFTVFTICYLKELSRHLAQIISSKRVLMIILCLKGITQLLILLLTAYIACTRIKDQMHYTENVILGLGVGSAIAIATFNSKLTPWFEK